MPNLQLYDLLAAIALNSGNAKLVDIETGTATTPLAEARNAIAEKAAVFALEKPAASPTAPVPSTVAATNDKEHSRHERRRLRGAWFPRRLVRLQKFEENRYEAWAAENATIEKAMRTHVVRGKHPSV